jgi:hypothetical protein
MASHPTQMGNTRDTGRVRKRVECPEQATARRLIAAAESLAIDYGGISIVSRATGVSRLKK